MAVGCAVVVQAATGSPRAGAVGDVCFMGRWLAAGKVRVGLVHG